MAPLFFLSGAWELSSTSLRKHSILHNSSWEKTSYTCHIKLKIKNHASRFNSLPWTCKYDFILSGFQATHSSKTESSQKHGKTWLDRNGAVMLQAGSGRQRIASCSESVSRTSLGYFPGKWDGSLGRFYSSRIWTRFCCSPLKMEKTHEFQSFYQLPKSNFKTHSHSK